MNLSEQTTFVSELITDKHSILKERSYERMASFNQVNVQAFKIEKLIGRGSYAKVFLVRKKETDECYAMKVLKKSKMENEKDVTRVFNEKEIIKDINHPFIVKLHYTFQTLNKAYFILDLLNGGDLYTHIMKCGKFKESVAKFYTAEIILALEHLHKHSIVYRDLKPQNIIVDSEGHIKLTDFGLSKKNFDMNQENTICGTMKYIAPETISGKRYNHMVDWWSLGIILYRMLTGQLPHPTNVNKKIPYYIINHKIAINKTLFTKHAADFLSKLLERDPTKRLGAKGIEEIKKHKFFKKVNWKKLYNKEVKPPFVPKDRLYHSGNPLIT